jgi:hypothetical protein
MDADTVEACLFAADDERGKVRQRPTDGNSESDADTGHLTIFLISGLSSALQRPSAQHLENEGSFNTGLSIHMWSTHGMSIGGIHHGAGNDVPAEFASRGAQRPCTTKVFSKHQSRISWRLADVDRVWQAASSVEGASAAVEVVLARSRLTGVGSCRHPLTSEILSQ